MSIYSSRILYLGLKKKTQNDNNDKINYSVHVHCYEETYHLFQPCGSLMCF